MQQTVTFSTYHSGYGLGLVRALNTYGVNVRVINRSALASGERKAAIEVRARTLTPIAAFADQRSLLRENGRSDVVNLIAVLGSLAISKSRTAPCTNSL